jgi:hypothetical protein
VLAIHFFLSAKMLEAMKEMFVLGREPRNFITG